MTLELGDSFIKSLDVYCFDFMKENSVSINIQYDIKITFWIPNI